MRIWDVDPGFLNDKSLLGEHRELHGLYSIHVNGKKGYARHPETLRWKQALSGLRARHGLLVSEMQLRGFNHKSPLGAPAPDQESGQDPDPGLTPNPLGTGPAPDWPIIFIDPPDRQLDLLRDKYRDKDPGRIPLPRNLPDLWAAHKYSVMARDPALYREIGPRVAAKTVTFPDLSLTLVRVLRQCPAPGRLVNALDHMWGYVSSASPVQRETLGPGPLLAEIRTRSRELGVAYLVGSTALGELGYWIRILSPGP